MVGDPVSIILHLKGLILPLVIGSSQACVHDKGALHPMPPLYLEGNELLW